MQPITGPPGMEVIEMSPDMAEDPAQVIPESLADLLERPLYAHMAVSGTADA